MLSRIAYGLLSLWIDGDHSYEGLKADWEAYTPLVVPGGYVMVDNYGDAEWPGVAQFLDNEVLGDEDPEGWSVIYKAGRTVLFQRDSE